MKKSATLVKLISPSGTAALSKGQKKFNALIKRIEKERQSLAAWQEMIPRYQKQHAAELAPLQEAFDAQRIAMAHRLDKVYPEKVFTKIERSKLSDLICNIVVELLPARDGDDALKELYNKHSGGDFDAEMAQEGAMVKDMMEAMFGVELGDEEIDFSSPEAMMQRVAASMREQQERESDPAQAGPAPKQRKKSAKTLEREARLEQEEQNVSQSIREVFRKLASALHPDKEQDPAERARKTALMQRVNVAYGDNDLLGLLELQLEIEQIDQAAIHSVSEERLKHYNKVLAEQADELAHEVIATRMRFALSFKLDPDEGSTPLAALRHLRQEIAGLREGLGSIGNDLAAFQDVKAIKRTLKDYRIAPADADWL